MLLLGLSQEKRDAMVLVHKNFPTNRAGLALVKIVRQREAPKFSGKGGHFQGFPKSVVAALRFIKSSLLAVAASGVG